MQEKKKIAKRRKYKMINHDTELWNKATEYFV